MMVIGSSTGEQFETEFEYVQYAQAKSVKPLSEQDIQDPSVDTFKERFDPKAPYPGERPLPIRPGTQERFMDPTKVISKPFWKRPTDYGMPSSDSEKAAGALDQEGLYPPSGVISMRVPNQIEEKDPTPYETLKSNEDNMERNMRLYTPKEMEDWELFRARKRQPGYKQQDVKSDATPDEIKAGQQYAGFINKPESYQPKPLRKLETDEDLIKDVESISNDWLRIEKVDQGYIIKSSLEGLSPKELRKRGIKP